jgi:hypothetical protein
MHSSVSGIRGALVRLFRKGEARWCAYCGGYAEHDAWEAHHVVVDERRTCDAVLVTRQPFARVHSGPVRHSEEFNSDASTGSGFLRSVWFLSAHSATQSYARAAHAVGCPDRAACGGRCALKERT